MWDNHPFLRDKICREDVQVFGAISSHRNYQRRSLPPTKYFALMMMTWLDVNVRDWRVKCINYLFGIKGIDVNLISVNVTDYDWMWMFKIVQVLRVSFVTNSQVVNLIPVIVTHFDEVSKLKLMDLINERVELHIDNYNQIYSDITNWWVLCNERKVVSV